MDFCIYIIKNSINKRFYIGSAKNFQNRKLRHLISLKKNKHHSKKLQNFCNKYGVDKIWFEIIEYCTPETILQREQHWLDTLHAVKNGFNILSIAGSSLGFKHSEKTKRNASIARKGTIPLAMLGKKHTDKTKDLIRQKAKLRKQSPETIANRVAKNTGKKRSESAKKTTALKISKLTKDQVFEIRILLSQKVNQYIIAKQFGVCQRNISRIKQGISYNYF